MDALLHDEVLFQPSHNAWLTEITVTIELLETSILDLDPLGSSSNHSDLLPIQHDSCVPILSERGLHRQ